MESQVNDLKKDPARSSHEDATRTSEKDERSQDRGINRIANEMADRGLSRERRDDQGPMVESDGHGSESSST